MSRRYHNLPDKCGITDEQIVAGVKLWMTCLNTGEELKHGGSDKEIAQIIHNSYLSYKRSKIREACNVAVFINEKFVHVLDHISNDTLLTFRLMDIKDVSRGLDRYSKFSVLVGKEYHDKLVKVYIFHNTKTPACFYNVTRRAFQLGFNALKRVGSTSSSQYSEGKDFISRTQELAIYNKKNRDETDFAKYGLCCQNEDISDSDEEFEWRTDQTCLLYPGSNVVEFHKTPRQTNHSFFRKKTCLC